MARDSLGPAPARFKKILDKRDALMGMRALGIDVIAMLETPQLIFGERLGGVFEALLRAAQGDDAQLRGVQ